jgi:hypothetical protein
VLVYAAMNVPIPQTTTAEAAPLPRHVLDEHAYHLIDTTLRQASPTPTDIEGVPLCTDHTPTMWHPLVKKNDGRILCTYGHEHHDNPHDVDDVFGPPAAWWGGTQEISYPWQTYNATTGVQENVAKHEGYKYFVAENQPCIPASGTSGVDGCFRAWRIQVHAMGHASDAVTRFHSYAMEALVQAPDGTQGIIRHTGWIDTGHLALQATGVPNGQVCPDLPTNPQTFTCGSGVKRSHSGANTPPPAVGHNTFFANWYATQQYAQVATHIEEWGPIDYQNPNNQLYFGGTANNSRGRPELMSVDLRQGRWNPYKDVQGRVTFSGYSDRNGLVLTQPCAPLGPDCTPFSIEGVEAYGYQWSANVGGAGALVDHDHDVMSPTTGRSLIVYPN